MAGQNFSIFETLQCQHALKSHSSNSALKYDVQLAVLQLCLASVNTCMLLFNCLQCWAVSGKLALLQIVQFRNKAFGDFYNQSVGLKISLIGNVRIFNGRKTLSMR